MDAQVLTDAGVSTREADVLSGVAEHLTNAEIAARLYISVRTVESHVSSLLRKLGVADRSELASYAAALAAQPAGSAGLGGAATVAMPRPPAPAIPTPLTSFVGRAVEREALAAAIAGHRLVTAVGPGGVGKTRLAIAGRGGAGAHGLRLSVGSHPGDGGWRAPGGRRGGTRAHGRHPDGHARGPATAVGGTAVGGVTTRTVTTE
jgi:DNA-binding CsgD family transcriptional regulator